MNASTGCLPIEPAALTVPLHHSRALRDHGVRVVPAAAVRIEAAPFGSGEPAPS
jgi:hypothetical protein